VLLGGVAWFAYSVLFPPQLLGTQVSEHPNLRAAALSWRNLYAETQRSAATAEIWKRVDGQFLVVEPAVANEKGETAALAEGAVGVFKAAAAAWKPTVARLSLSQQTESLGEELLARGTFITVLASTDENRDERLFFVSADSPEAGHLPGSVRVTEYAECLPLVADEQLQGGLLASPMDPKADAVYWLAWRNGRTQLLKTTACAGEAQLQPQQVISTEIPKATVPLLTLQGETPYLLALGRGEGAPSPVLFQYSGSGSALSAIGSVEPAPKGIVSDTSVPSPLYDSFHAGLPSADPKEPSVPVRAQAADGATLYLVQTGKQWGFYGCAAPSSENFVIKGVSDTCLYAQGANVTLTHEELHPCRIGDKGDGERCEVTPEGLMLSYYFRDVKSGLYCRIIVENQPCVPPGSTLVKDLKELERVR
jgi:hypothetical protein